MPLTMRPTGLGVRVSIRTGPQFDLSTHRSRRDGADRFRSHSNIMRW